MNIVVGDDDALREIITAGLCRDRFERRRNLRPPIGADADLDGAPAVITPVIGSLGQENRLPLKRTGPSSPSKAARAWRHHGNSAATRRALFPARQAPAKRWAERGAG
jgi:hypothetical protein